MYINKNYTHTHKRKGKTNDAHVTVEAALDGEMIPNLNYVPSW